MLFVEIFIDSNYSFSRDTKHNLYVIVHDKKRLIKTASEYDLYSPELLPLSAVLPLLPHNRAVPARGGWHRYENDIIYSLNVAAQKHPESLDLLYFLFKGISTYMYLF